MTTWAYALALLLVGAAGPATADTLSLPPPPHERTGTLVATYHMDAPSTGRLEIRWTDALGRIVQQTSIRTSAANQTIAIPLDMTHAVTLRNELHASLVPATGVTGAELTAEFIARPSETGWRDYEIMMWQRQTPQNYQALRRQNVTGAMLYAKWGHVDDDALSQVLDGGMRFYLENLATDFLAPYHLASSRALFDAAQALYAKDPSSTAAFMRQPSLSDPQWLARIEDRLQHVVASFSQYRPLFYNLADESGIGDLAAPWDFDLSPVSLAAMRVWLAEQYGSLDALNAQWDRHFANWDDVVPLLTTPAIGQVSDNFSAWADFKAWMDVAFARALRAGTQAVHAADPTALSAIEGVQVPGWGGYDFGKLAGTVDVMELYDYGANVEIAHALDPDLVMLTTSAVEGPAATNLLWHEILLGIRGQILWDETGAVQRSSKAAALFQSLRGGVPAQLIAGTPHRDDVAILYSQASFRTRWLLDRRAEGGNWATRHAETEYEQSNPWRAAMLRAVDILSHRGIQPRWITPEQLVQGALRQNVTLLILPHSIALAAGEADAIRTFVAAGGRVAADAEPGQFDAHSRRRPQAALADLHAAMSSFDSLNTLSPTGFTLTDPNGEAVTDVQPRGFTIGNTTLLALHRDPGKSASNEAVQLTLPTPKHIVDVGAGRDLGTTALLELSLDPTTPTILALARSPAPEFTLRGPDEVAAGQMAEFQLSRAALADDSIVHVDIIDPDGATVPYYSGNTTLGTDAAWHVPLAVNDRPGQWTARFQIILTGQTATANFRVR